MELKIIVCWIPWQSTIAWVCLSTNRVWHETNFSKSSKHKTPPCIQLASTCTRPQAGLLRSTWALSSSSKLHQDQRRPEEGRSPLPMPRLTYTSAETHFDVCFKPLLHLFFPSEDDRLPSFTRSFALYSEAGRKDTVGRGHSVLKIKQVNFPSDRCSGGQGEEESTPQDTEMSSWQCNHTHWKQQSHIAQ